MSLSWFPLLQRGVLEIQGPDASKLLHGQCTADAQNLSVGRWVLGGLSTPKGRLYANFILARLGDDRFWLIMPVAQIDDTRQRLGKYAVFYKVTLNNISTQWHGVGLSGSSVSSDAGTVHPEAHRVTITLSSTHHMEWLNALEETSYEARLAELETLGTAQPETAWNYWEVQQGWVWVTPDSTEAWIPQMIAWDVLGGVNYKKGCFTGQEVIARLHYKGQSKRQLFRLSGSGTAPDVGSKVTTIELPESTVGEVVRSADLTSHWCALAILTLSDQTTSLRVNGQDIVACTTLGTD